MYHGLDGAMAARALGMLSSVESAPVLVDAFMKVDPQLKKVANPEYGQYPLSWTDFRTKMTILPALGQLHCAAAKTFLESYMTMDEAKAREMAPILFEDATRAYLKQHLTLDELKALLTSRHSSVRGTAILEYLDHPSPERKRALSEAAPWALSLPGASRAAQRGGHE
jgi:hypothetical protein